MGKEWKKRVAQWFAEHGDYLYRFALSRGIPPEKAEDLVQDVFTSLLAKGDTFRGESAPRTYLTSILRNKIIDHFREAGRRSRTESSDIEEVERILFTEEGEWAHPPSLWKSNPERMLKDESFREALLECLDGLPEKQKAAFILREVEGMESDEVCKILGISATNYHVLLHRARLRLQSCLERTWFGASEEEK
ncbi:MAG: sigma-70 family RNA polymerase sigma factor [Deltaproteobacteria bacterium]|nr:MAG: sigma-70 family RNA polymerase sigma factor [Deltaproteobacteria bacterium]